MNETNALLSLISDWDVLKSEGCAHSIRENGRSVERLSTKNIEIRAKEDGSGLDIYALRTLMGHASVTTTEIYLHICDMDKRRAALARAELARQTEIKTTEGQ